MRALFLIGAVLLAPLEAWAADEVTVSALLSDRRVLVGDVVTLQIRSVARVQGEIDVRVPSVAGLRELGRSRSEGTSISWSSAGGQQVTREQTLTVQLQAERPGQLRIPPVVAQVAGHRALSSPMSLEVMGEEALADAAESVGAGEVTPPDPEERDLFVRYRSSASEAFLGEQILLDLEIFAAPNRNFSLEEVPAPPELDGFWKELLYKPDRLTRSIEKVGGRTYHVYRVWRAGLFGLTAGERTLPPLRLAFSSGRGMFSRGRRVTVRTRPIKLEVKPLPTEGRPSGFKSTNVGQYRLDAKVDRTVVPAGKAVVLTLTLSGEGNIANAKLPELGDLDGFRVFPPTVKSDVNTSPAGVRGEKRAEILLMPTRGGRLEIPSIDLPVFDPKKAEYVRLSTPSIRIAVEGEPTAPVEAAPAAPAPSQAEAELRPIRFRSELEPWSPPPFTRWSYFGALAAPPLCFVLLLLGERLWARLRRETPASRRRAAARAAQGRLDEARRLAEAGRIADAYAAFSEAVMTLGPERFGVGLRGRTTEQIGALLRERGVDAEIVDTLVEELETADYARFAPGAVAGTTPERALERWTRIIAALSEGAR